MSIIPTNILCMAGVNTRIRNEICHNTLSQLSDESLLPVYMRSPSVKKKVSLFRKSLDKSRACSETDKRRIMNDYKTQLIPPGLKGVVRGNKFNKIVEQYLNSVNLDTTRFNICFEKGHLNHPTSEIPDWYIYEPKTDRIIIGMNQLDLWSGGHQTNRASKYLYHKNTDSCKLVCVVCNDKQFKSENSKDYKLVKHGFENDTLCYLNNLQNIIVSYFGHQ
jgi:hypothetical protein